MNPKKKFPLFVIMILLLVLTSLAIGDSAVMAAPLQTVERSVIGGGGGTLSGGNYTLDATIGQPVTGLASANLCSGFWCGVLDMLGNLLYLPIILR